MGRNIIKYLLGEDSFDGYWFGDKPQDKRPPFWWRNHLRSAVPQWVSASDMLPEPGERVIIYLQGFKSTGNRPQFATYNAQSGVFTNAGATQFKPEQINFWMSASALPEPPTKP